MKRVLISIALVVATLGRLHAQETYRFGVSVHNVYVDVFVSNKGEPLTGLEPSHFEVLDNGVRQQIQIVDMEAEGIPLSCYLILDMSFSVRGRVLKNLKEASHAFLGGLDPKDESGLITFSQEIRPRSLLSRDPEATRTEISRTTAEGATALYDAIYTGVKLIETAIGRPTLLLFTDGDDTVSWLTEDDILAAVENSDAVVYVVGIEPKGGLVNPMLNVTSAHRYSMQQISRSSGGEVYYADSAAELKSVYLKVLQELKNRYLLTYQPQGVPSEGWHTLEVKLKGVKADVRARRGYFYNPPPN